jgi:hypothetical protein
MVHPIVHFLMPEPIGTIGILRQGCCISIGADFCFFIYQGWSHEADRLPYPATPHSLEDRVQCFNRDELLFAAACVGGQFGKILEQFVRTAGGSGPDILGSSVGLIPPRG